jgi:hypothetical protein
MSVLSLTRRTPPSGSKKLSGAWSTLAAPVTEFSYRITPDSTSSFALEDATRFAI